MNRWRKNSERNALELFGIDSLRSMRSFILPSCLIQLFLQFVWYTYILPLLRDVFSQSASPCPSFGILIGESIFWLTAVADRAYVNKNKNVNKITIIIITIIKTILTIIIMIIIILIT